MNVTTSRSFRKKNLRLYPQSHFDSEWDHFVYLHLNDTTRHIHLLGTIIGLCLFPWAMRELFLEWSLWPTLVYTFFFYGFGFTSHYLCEGQVSETWRQFMKAYKFAVRLNWITIKGAYAQEEEHFKQSYPETLWIYRADAPIFHSTAEPRDLKTQSDTLLKSHSNELNP